MWACVWWTGHMAHSGHRHCNSSCVCDLPYTCTYMHKKPNYKPPIPARPLLANRSYAIKKKDELERVAKANR